MIEGLSTLSVKAVVGALYEGMGVVGGGGRVRIECLKLAGMLATQAWAESPRFGRDGPRLAEIALKLATLAPASRCLLL